MTHEPLVFDLQRANLDLAYQLAVGQGGVDVFELTPEGAYHHVTDRETGHGVHGVNGPGAAGDLGCALLGVSSHLVPPGADSDRGPLDGLRLYHEKRTAVRAKR